MSDPETIRLYDTKAADYARLVKAASPDATLQAYIEALPRGAHVLDLGCGPGRSAALMARAGLVVEAWDASAEMVRLAAAQPGVTARLARFGDLAARATYDGIWANFSLLHAPRADLPAHLAAIHCALKSAGLFHIAVKEGSGEARDALGRFYTYYTEAELTDLLRAAGFTPGSFKRGIDKGLAGDVSPWISVTARA